MPGQAAERLARHAGARGGYPLYPQLASALGWSSAVDSSATAAPRFERVMLLFDPDADGIHIGALMLLYLQRFAPALLAQGHVFMIRAPLASLRVAARDAGKVEGRYWAYTPEQARALRQRAAAAPERWAVLREWGFRGLASLPPGCCAKPASMPPRGAPMW